MTPETLTRAEAHRKLLALGMSADVAADYLDSEASLTARLAVSLACPGAWPILEAYQRHCKSKAAATDPLDTVPAEERDRIRNLAREERKFLEERAIAREVAAYHARTAGPEFQPGYHHPDPVIDQEVRLDLAEGRAVDKSAGIREGWHRNAECCEWHRTGGRTASLCNTLAHRSAICARAQVDVIAQRAFCHASLWTPESWNTCPKCKGPVEKAGGDVNFADGDEAKCTDCGTVLMVSIAEDGGPCSVYEPEANVVAQDERSEVCRRMQAALFHIRTAQQMALESVPGGEVRLAIVAKDATGAGSLAGDFDAKPFLADVTTLFRVFRTAGLTVDSGQDIEARAEGACRAFEKAIESEDMPAHLMLRAAWRDVVRYCDSSARAKSAESLFAKWTPLLSPYLNEEQLADLRRDIMRAEVVKDANQPGLTGDAWTSLVRAIATLAENDSLVDDAITATERAGCPADVVLHLREINDAMYRRRMRGQSGITWSTAIKVAIALAPHGDVTAQAQTVMRIAGKQQGITEEAIDALHALAGAMPWHPFTPGMTSEALCSFCGKTAGEHVGAAVEAMGAVLAGLGWVKDESGLWAEEGYGHLWNTHDAFRIVARTITQTDAKRGGQ